MVNTMGTSKHDIVPEGGILVKVICFVAYIFSVKVIC